ncbi:GGDEF domain-containing protein [Cupriavidus sp. UME77]|uniref:GGDEF domain-containing protein n=1 Tax=Cupriavidus sp. UME77 TaxID=1862321 RepID=UPI001D99C80F|nr:GGDEF domain-containing protein [Cupriavidus sp. UME77]MBB1631950.1 hypothetical protein [Cupriavidus sp. UME77]
MILLSLGPCCLAALLTDETVMRLTLVQIPFYLVAMSIAAFHLNRLLVTTMKAERESDRMARHDALTGLPNRVGLAHASALLSKENQAADGKTAVLYMDLDGFKPVNDLHGHDAGDRLLVTLGKRLNALKGPDDMVFRIGGDEFVVIVRAPDENGVAVFADRLLDEVPAPFPSSGDVSVRVGVSVGVAMIPEHGADVMTALTAADKALNLAKLSGKAKWTLATEHQD